MSLFLLKCWLKLNFIWKYYPCVFLHLFFPFLLYLCSYLFVLWCKTCRAALLLKGITQIDLLIFMTFLSRIKHSKADYYSHKEMFLGFILIQRESKGALALGNLYRAWARLTPKVKFVWLVWALCSVLKHGRHIHAHRVSSRNPLMGYVKNM